MATGNIYLLRCELTTWDVNHSFNTHWVDTNGASEGTGAQQLAAAAQNNLTPSLRAILSDDTVVEAWYAIRVKGGPENPGLRQINDGKGMDTGAAYPPNSCLVCSFIGEDPQLKRAGRIYIGGVPKSKIQAGKFDATYLSGVVKTWTDKLKMSLTEGTNAYNIVVYRTVDNGMPMATPIGVPPDACVAQPVVYSQRRRNSKSRGLSAIE